MIRMFLLVLWAAITMNGGHDRSVLCASPPPVDLTGSAELAGDEVERLAAPISVYTTTQPTSTTRAVKIASQKRPTSIPSDAVAVELKRRLAADERDSVTRRLMAEFLANERTELLSIPDADLGARSRMRRDRLVEIIDELIDTLDVDTAQASISNADFRGPPSLQRSGVKLLDRIVSLDDRDSTHQNSVIERDRSNPFSTLSILGGLALIGAFPAIVVVWLVVAALGGILSRR